MDLSDHAVLSVVNLVSGGIATFAAGANLTQAQQSWKQGRRGDVTCYGTLAALAFGLGLLLMWLA